MKKNCAGCDHLKKNAIAMSGFVYSCKATGGIVPHRVQRTERPEPGFKVTFWRVPMDCPLPNALVERSEEIVAIDDQTTQWVEI